jgi:glycosyltransferase involved in cell wall biosynthesis
MSSASAPMNSSPRILFLNSLGIVGGQEVVMLDIIRHLDRRYGVVAATLLDGPLVQELRSLAVETHVLPPHRIRQPLRFACALRALRHIIERERIDIVHCNGDTLLIYGALAVMGLGTPCVWHVYEPVSKRGSGFVRLVYQVQRRLRAAWTIFGTAAVKESYLADYPRLGGHTEIMPGVDVEGVNRGADAGAARRALGIPDDVPILLVIARLQRSKGQRELLEAVARLDGFDPAPHVVLCGGRAVMTDEDFYDELVALARTLGLSERIHLTGHVTDAEKKNLLAAATLLVHPAQREAFGIAVIEGMAAGKPVVVTDAVGPTSIVAGSGAGEIVKAKDIAALAGGIRKRLENPGESRKMGELGRARVLERYSIASMVKKVEAVYDAVLSNAAP